MTTIVGIVASICIAVSLLPQLKKLISEKQAEDISLGMLIILSIGQVLWIWYGFLKHDWIIISSNCFSLMVDILTLGLSIKYKRNSSNSRA